MHRVHQKCTGLWNDVTAFVRDELTTKHDPWSIVHDVRTLVSSVTSSDYSTPYGHGFSNGTLVQNYYVGIQSVHTSCFRCPGYS